MIEVFSKVKYEYHPNILGHYVMTSEYVNGRNYYVSKSHKGKYGIWWDGSKNWIVGLSNLHKGKNLGYARLNKNTKTPINQKIWMLYHGKTQEKHIWRKAVDNFGLKWSAGKIFDDFYSNQL